jgi:hypothetical protein
MVQSKHPQSNIEQNAPAYRQAGRPDRGRDSRNDRNSKGAFGYLNIGSLEFIWNLGIGSWNLSEQTGSLWITLIK